MTKIANLLTGALTAATLATAGHAADTPAAEAFAAARLANFGAGDIEALLAQYSDDAMIVSPMGIIDSAKGRRGMIEAIVGEFAQPGVTFELISQKATGDIVQFVWSAVTNSNVYDLGVETYVLHDGKAIYQTFAAKVTPK